MTLPRHRGYTGWAQAACALKKNEPPPAAMIGYPPMLLSLFRRCPVLMAGLLAGSWWSTPTTAQVHAPAAVACYQQAAARADEARSLCARAAADGDAHAAFLLAQMESDEALRVSRLERAVELGHPRAAAVLAAVRRRAGNAEEANRLEATAARAGYGPSRIRVAQALRADPDNAEYLARARRMLFAEAVVGYAEAQYLLAGMLKTGEGGDADAEGARRWMLEAASSGLVQAQFEFGLAQVAERPGEARRWLTKAARSGHVGAMMALSRLLLDGGSGGRGLELAGYWANRAVLAGHPQAPALLEAVVAARAAPSADPAALVAGVQQLLARLGYDPGPVDGVPGARTRTALQAFRRAHGLPGEDSIDAAALAQLREAADR